MALDHVLSIGYSQFAWEIRCGFLFYTSPQLYSALGPLLDMYKHILAHLLCCHFGRPNHLSLLIKHFNTSSQFIVPHQHHIAHTNSDWWTREWGERSKQGYSQCCYKYLLLTHTVKVHHQTVCVYLSKLVVLMWQVNTNVSQYFSSWQSGKQCLGWVFMR